MSGEMKVSLEDVQALVTLTKQKTEQIYAAINEMKNQIVTTIDGGLWVGEDATSFKIYMFKDLGKAWSTAKWLEKVTAEMEAYVQKLLAQAENRAQTMATQGTD